MSSTVEFKAVVEREPTELRQTLTFQVSELELRKAATARAEHHREREAFWEEQLSIAQDAMREATVQIREQAVTGGVQVQAIIDPTLSARVQECTGKRDSHRTKAEEFEAWARAFKEVGTTRTLTFADLRHFEV